MKDTTRPILQKSFQRRTVLVKKTLQLKYIALVFCSVLLAALVVGGDVYYTMARLILVDNPSLEPMMSQVNSMILVKLILYLGIIFLISLFLSHRFAGPIYRFEKSARAVASGDLTHRVSLRKGDELMELQEEFNRMVETLQTQIHKDRSLLSRISQRLEQLPKSLNHPQAGQSPSIPEEIQSLQRELEHVTSGFKVE